MANLKEIRVRINSVKSTRQITSAMKMVSAAKLRKAQDAITQMRPYAEKLHEILLNISASLEDETENVYGDVREPEKVLLIVITSNKGMCGAFNSNVIKQTIEVTKGMYREQNNEGQLDIIGIGRKGTDFLTKHGYNVIHNYNDIFDELTYDNVLPIVEEMMKNFVDGKYDKIDLIYNQFKNAAIQFLQVENFLPVNVQTDEPEYMEPVPSNYIFEPSKEFIINELIPKSLKIQFYKALLDSHASEHGARMTAMHQATDNATELLKQLSLTYNKARQANITNEILEIVSGAEALKKR
jgi:F-type H+-transporting ATPase subunit gamma